MKQLELLKLNPEKKRIPEVRLEEKVKDEVQALMKAVLVNAHESKSEGAKRNGKI